MRRMKFSKERKEILRICQEVRESLGRKIKDRCAEASEMIQKKLKKAGIKAEIVNGVFCVDRRTVKDRKFYETRYGDEYWHTWIMWRGKIVDVTATQFNPYCKIKLPNIIVGTKHINRYVRLTVLSMKPNRR